MKPLALFLLAALTGCTTLNPAMPELTIEDCDRLGVDVFTNDGPALPVSSETVGTFGTVDKACNPEGGFLAAGQIHQGCIKPDGAGGFGLYAESGQSLAHEWCHALYGPDHRNDARARKIASEGPEVLWRYRAFREAPPDRQRAILQYAENPWNGVHNHNKWLEFPPGISVRDRRRK